MPDLPIDSPVRIHTRLRRRDLIALASGITLGAVMGQSALAQSSGNIRIIVPFPAGGINDSMVRLLGDSVSKQLQRNVIVDNRPGAAGVIGTKLALQAPNDGSTTLVSTYIGFYGLPFTQKAATYDPHKEFKAVAMIGDGPAMLFVHESVPAKTFPEFLVWAKAQKSGVDAATSGPGGGSHTWATWMSQRAGINLVTVPYKGGSEMVKALITGEVKFMLSTTSEALNAQVKAGKVRVLAVASDRSSSLAPGVPTISQTLPGFIVEGWYGLHAPATTSNQEIEIISAAIKRALEEPALRERYLGMYIEPRYANPAEFEAAGVKTTEFWKRLVAELGMTPQ